MRRVPVLRDKTVGAEGVPGTIADSSVICAFLYKKLNAGLYGASTSDIGLLVRFEEDADTVLAPSRACR